MKRHNLGSHAALAATGRVKELDSVKALLAHQVEPGQPAANLECYARPQDRSPATKLAYAPPTLTRLGTVLTMSKSSVQLCARAFGSGGTT